MSSRFLLAFLGVLISTSSFANDRPEAVFSVRPVKGVIEVDDQIRLTSARAQLVCARVNERERTIPALTLPLRTELILKTLPRVEPKQYDITISAGMLRLGVPGDSLSDTTGSRLTSCAYVLYLEGLDRNEDVVSNYFRLARTHSYGNVPEIRAFLADTTVSRKVSDMLKEFAVGDGVYDGMLFRYR